MRGLIGARFRISTRILHCATGPAETAAPWLSSVRASLLFFLGRPSSPRGDFLCIQPPRFRRVLIERGRHLVSSMMAIAPTFPLLFLLSAAESSKAVA